MIYQKRNKGMDEREQLENELLKAQIERERAQQRLAEEQEAEIERNRQKERQSSMSPCLYVN